MFRQIVSRRQVAKHRGSFVLTPLPSGSCYLCRHSRDSECPGQRFVAALRFTLITRDWVFRTNMGMSIGIFVDLSGSSSLDIITASSTAW